MTAPAGNDNGGANGGDPAGDSSQQPGNEQHSRGGSFTPITSQDQFDKAFDQRWSREQAKVNERYAGFDDIKAKAEKYDQAEAAKKTDAERREAADKEKDAALQKAEARADAAEKAALKQRVAIEEGLDPKFASRLSGDTEDEIRADAKEVFGEFIRPAVPPFDHGPRNQSAPQSMNDLIFGAAKRR